MTREGVQAWLDDYVDAWRSYDADAIGALFADDAEYRYHPYDEPLRGRQAIVESWLGDRDEAGSWEARYEALVVEGDRAVATGETRYATGRTFSNVFALAFDGEGRCLQFTEWYVEHPT
jgi:ketosteroid isomerase-like protein